MSSCRIALTSTIVSSSCCSSLPDSGHVDTTNKETAAVAIAVIACGAIAAEARAIARKRDGRIEVHVLPALLHNHPKRIATEVEALAKSLQATGRAVVVAYADCGTYGALDDVCSSLGLQRLAGLHCYDVLAGPEQVERLFDDEPGTYLLTDFLVRSFARTIVSELGLDRHPELWPDYFGNYRRIVWIAQQPSEELETKARAIADRFGLPLEIVPTGISRLEDELDRLIDGLSGAAPSQPTDAAPTLPFDAPTGAAPAQLLDHPPAESG
jgi:hypothetical protein